MKTKQKIIYILMATILILLPCAANPNILKYNGGQWYNDRGELQNTNLIQEYKTIIEKPDNWSIEVIKPAMTYQNSKQTYNNGEKIIITSGATITLSGKVNEIVASKINPIIIEIK